MKSKTPRKKLLEFTITVRATDGKLSSFTQPALNLEEAAALACRRVSLQRTTPQRTTGAVGEPGWFYPRGKNPSWPFAGNPYRVDPKVD